MTNQLKVTKVLITGASGFLGHALVRRLCAEGREVTAVSRSKSTQPPAHWETVERYEEVWPLLAGQSCVVHLAARVHVMGDTAIDPLAEFRLANVDLTLYLARQAAQAGVRRFLYISSVKVNGEVTLPGRPFRADDEPAPLDPYGISKMEAELGLRKIAAETGLDVVVIRPPLVYGPGVRANFRALLLAVRRGLPLPLGAIDNRRSLVSLDNLLDLIVTCIGHPAAANQTFLVSDGDDVSTPELVRRIAKAMGRPARLIPVPVWLLQAATTMLNKPDMAQRLCGSLQLDIEKTRQLLGWRPPLSLDTGMKLVVEGFAREKGI